MGILYNPNIVMDGLVLALDAGNPKSYPGTGTTWTDLSGNGGSGTNTNSPTYNSSGYFNYDGASDYTRVDRSDLNAGSFAYGEITCELWYRPSSSGSAGVSGNNLITVENSFEISVGNNGNGYHGINYASNPWAWYGTTGNVLTNSVWNLITFVHASSGRWLYVNGVEVFTRSDTGNIASGNSTYPYLTLMGRYTGTSSGAEGDLASVKLYNRVLTTSEIQKNFQATRSRFGI